MENAVCIVEVQISVHNRPEIKEVKIKEIQNLEDYDTFQLVEDVGQKMVGSYWLITKNEKYDG